MNETKGQKIVLRFYHRGFTYILFWNNQPLEFLFPGSDGYGQHGPHGLYAAIEPQLTDHHVIAQTAAIHLAVGSEDPHCHRQVKTAAFFL